MSGAIRILIADDHPVVRDGLAAMLGTQPDFQVVALAAAGSQVIEQAQVHEPDVILLDLEMPNGGVETLRRLRSVRPGQKVLVFTAYDTDELIVGAVQAGAQGYLLKGAPRDEIFNAIRVISSGGSLLQPVVASRLLQRLNEKQDEPLVEPLTEREAEVLEWLAQGKSNKEIAAALGISQRTAKFHVGSIMRKLGAANRTEAVTLAAQRGLIDLSNA